MSIKNYNTCYVVYDATTGDIIDSIDTSLYENDTIKIMINDLFDKYVLLRGHGISIKEGYKDKD